jgi:hypothetical protein
MYGMSTVTRNPRRNKGREMNAILNQPIKKVRIVRTVIINEGFMYFYINIYKDVSKRRQLTINHILMKI